jgi:ABC-2 type transport system permease protein
VTVAATLLRRRLRDDRRPLLGWGLGLAGLLGLYLWVWPSIRDNPHINELLASYPPEVLALLGTADIASPTGYMNAEFFTLMGPILLLVFAIRRGSAAVAGPEDSGVVELWLATPYPRRRVVLEGFAWMAAGTGLLALLAAAVVLLGNPLVSLTIPPTQVLAACLSLLMLAVFFGTTALAVGAVVGRTGLPGAVATAVAVVAFLVHSFAPLVDVLEPIQEASPWHWYVGADPLTNGFDPAGAAALLTGTAVLLVAAVVAYERRDLQL